MAQHRSSHDKPTLTLAIVAALVIIGVAGYFVSSAVEPRPKHVALGPRVELSGYSTRLPVGVAVEPGAHCFGPLGHLRAPEWFAEIPTHGGLTYSLQTRTSTSCIGSMLSATYGVLAGADTHPRSPEVAPGAVMGRIGPYHVSIVGASSISVIGCLGPNCQAAAEADGLVTITVQIPTTGGGYHDLVVATLGLTGAQAVSLVKGALPRQLAARPAGRPPWTLLPVCRPGQSADPFGPSAMACGVVSPASASGADFGGLPWRLA